MIDQNIYSAVREYLDFAAANPPAEGAIRHSNGDMIPLGEHAGYGVRLNIRANVDFIATVPGGQTLMIYGVPPSYPAVPVIDLDFAFDLTDGLVRRLREPIVAALIDAGKPFLPVSVRALQNIGGPSTWAALQLVDLDGQQCVFHVGALYFISGFDANEDPPLYFLARLPHEVASYAEGIEALKPRSVKLAEAEGLRVRRQGDMFAIPTTWRSHDLRAMGAVFSTNVTIKRSVPNAPHFRQTPWTLVVTRDGPHIRQANVEPAFVTVEDTKRRGLYGTAHTATELAYLPDGTMFARGRIEHDPRGVLNEHREADHAPLVLPGKTWYLVARNTVPIQERG